MSAALPHAAVWPPFLVASGPTVQPPTPRTGVQRHYSCGGPAKASPSSSYLVPGPPPQQQQQQQQQQPPVAATAVRARSSEDPKAIRRHTLSPGPGREPPGCLRKGPGYGRGRSSCPEAEATIATASGAL